MSSSAASVASHPVLSCEEARAFEQRLFGGDETQEWSAMRRAGGAVGAAVLRDFQEIGGFPADGRVLVLVGKGHNGGDALIATAEILRRHPLATAEVVFVFGERTLKPLALRAWREAQSGPELSGRVAAISAAAIGAPRAASAARLPGTGADAPPMTGTPGHAASLEDSTAYDLCVDGVFGFQFRPPAEPRIAELIERVNTCRVRFRAAVDLPSGGLFHADFTYATGSVKSPALDRGTAGRVRYLDLGFFDAAADHAGTSPRVLIESVLAPLAVLRPAACDKRTYGHLFVLGGSRSYPGAVLMTTLAALRSGAGLVTAFVPESLVAAYAARAPEAMWVGWPETPHGGLALEGAHLLRERLERATALVMGPGLSRDPETLALVKDLVGTVNVPVLLDADALQRDILRAAKTPVIVTPHAGEFARIAGGASPEEFVVATHATLVLKSAVTRVASGAAGATGADPAAVPVVYHSFFGGPVLARGGSGDLLAGIIGGLLAQRPEDPLLAAARGVAWHGLAADHLARAHGQVAVNTTQLLDFLPVALRDCQSRAPRPLPAPC